jgi:hypothetical protein
MSNKAKAAFNVLGAHANWETGECFLAVSTIAKEAGYQRRAMFYAINELEELGAIIVKRKLGEVNHYLIVHYQKPEADDRAARPAGADDDGRPAEALAPDKDAEARRTDSNGAQLQGQEEEKQLQIPFEHNINLSVTDLNESVQQPAEDKKQQKGQTLDKEDENSDRQQKQAEQQEEGNAKEDKRLIIGGMHINATPQAYQCTTPSINMHQPVHNHAHKQKQVNGNINFPYKNTSPPVDKWYRELTQQQQAYVLCCTKNINQVMKSVLGNFIPPMFIMEKLMVGFEPQFLIKIINNCNAPMILNPIGWFRDIKPWWHVKGESPEQYWHRMAAFGMQPFFGLELEQESMSEETENSLDEDKNNRPNFDDTQQEEAINSDKTLSPRAQQTIRLMNQYNSMLADAQMVYSLAQEEDATEQEKVDLIFHYHELRDKGKKVIDRIEQFGYIGNQEQMESGFVIDQEVISKLKQFRD